MSRYLLLTALIALLLMPVLGQIASAEGERVPIMHPGELKPGDRGHGLTVFQGVEPVKFDVEILGVLGNRFAGGDMILFRADPRPEFEDIGVVAGMSGSPVFVDGKLIGAVAYGWGFTVRPIGGITPITDMLEVLDLITVEPNLLPEDIPAGMIDWETQEKPRSLEEFGRLAGRLATGLSSLEPLSFPADELRALGIRGIDAETPRVTFQPLSTPLSVSTRSPLVMRVVEKAFEGSLLNPVMTGGMEGLSGQGTGGRSGHLSEEEYEALGPVDGGALGVVLADGDLQLAATGTITLVEGDRLIAFGHPMYGMGPMDAPVYTAEVTSVVPSVIRPFKIGNAIKEVGALREDRLAAIGATTAARSRMVPMQVSVSAEDTGVERDFHFRLWNHREFLPILAMICYLESLEKASRLDGAMSVEMEYAVTLSDGRELRRSAFTSAEVNAPFLIMFDLMMDVAALVNNRFEPVAVESISVKTDIRRRHQVMRLDSFSRGPVELKRGETFEAKLRYHQWRDETLELPITVDIPAGLRPGKYEVLVMDGVSRDSFERSLRPELRRVESLDELLRAASPVFPDDAVHVLLIDPSPQYVFDGRMLENLPTSVAATTEATVRRSGQAFRGGARLVSEQVHRFPARVVGTTNFSLTITSE